MEEGAKTAIKINEKLILNLDEIKNFIKEKDDFLKKAFDYD